MRDGGHRSAEGLQGSSANHLILPKGSQQRKGTSFTPQSLQYGSGEIWGTSQHTFLSILPSAPAMTVVPRMRAGLTSWGSGCFKQALYASA